AQIYGTNDRAWKFWEQARRAETRPSADALEVFYLCAMLGFRGELGQDAAALTRWAEGSQARLSREHATDWPSPPDLDSPTFVPPLRARDHFQRMLLICGMGLLLIIPLVVFMVVRQLGQ